jgi:predicted  nucleic acid-binding Zn-ribbon protein
MNSEEQLRQAQANFKTITDIKGKLEILAEHVESRKEGLEEEIEENLNEAIRNARDCLEKIQENIEPKLAGIIREKLDVLKVKMDRFTEEGLDALHK